MCVYIYMCVCVCMDPFLSSTRCGRVATLPWYYRRRIGARFRDASNCLEPRIGTVKCKWIQKCTEMSRNSEPGWRKSAGGTCRHTTPTQYLQKVGKHEAGKGTWRGEKPHPATPQHLRKAALTRQNLARFLCFRSQLKQSAMNVKIWFEQLHVLSHETLARAFGHTAFLLSINWSLCARVKHQLLVKLRSLRLLFAPVLPAPSEIMKWAWFHQFFLVLETSPCCYTQTGRTEHV